MACLQPLSEADKERIMLLLPAAVLERLTAKPCAEAAAASPDSLSVSDTQINEVLQEEKGQVPNSTLLAQPTSDTNFAVPDGGMTGRVRKAPRGKSQRKMSKRGCSAKSNVNTIASIHKPKHDVFLCENA